MRPGRDFLRHDLIVQARKKLNLHFLGRIPWDELPHAVHKSLLCSFAKSFNSVKIRTSMDVGNIMRVNEQPRGYTGVIIGAASVFDEEVARDVSFPNASLSHAP